MNDLRSDVIGPGKTPGRAGAARIKANIERHKLFALGDNELDSAVVAGLPKIEVLLKREGAIALEQFSNQPIFPQNVDVAAAL